MKLTEHEMKKLDNIIKTDSNIDRKYSKFKETISDEIKRKGEKNDNSKRSSL